MEPLSIVVGGGTIAMIAMVARIIYNYGRDRKELNGTVARVKLIEADMGSVKEDVSYIRGTLDQAFKARQQD